MINRLASILSKVKSTKNPPLDGLDGQNIFPQASERAIKTAALIRGVDRPPAIFLHGVTQRSGTNYIGELLDCFPDICIYPGDVREIPFLSISPDLDFAQRKFISYFPRNARTISPGDFLPLFGASMIAYLYSFVTDHRQILVKVPSVQYLHNFYNIFPHEDILLLLRDGRDVVYSINKTWPDRDFRSACRRWSLSARMIQEFDEKYRGTGKRYLVARYENIYADPEGFLRNVSKIYELDYEKNSFDGINQLPVIGSSVVRREGEVTWEPLKKPRDFQPIGRWQAWSIKEKDIFKQIAGQTLLDLGYCKNLDW